MKEILYLIEAAKEYEADIVIFNMGRFLANLYTDKKISVDEEIAIARRFTELSGNNEFVDMGIYGREIYNKDDFILPVAKEFKYSDSIGNPNFWENTYSEIVDYYTNSVMVEHN